MLMKTVIAVFILHIQKNDYAAGQTDGQGKYIDKGIRPVFVKDPKSYFKKTPCHVKNKMGNTEYFSKIVPNILIL